MKKKVKKRFFAILLLLAIVFTNVGTDFFYVQASSIEANESVQEENTETITDTGTVEIGTDSVSDTEEVSESTETVEDTEKVDESTETVADTEVIDTEEDIPEEVTPEEEQIPDQEYTWRDTTVERNLYYDDWSKDNMGRIYLGETLEELFQMYEDPTLEMAGWEDFFAGTCFAGATLEDLKWLQESGYTMDQLIQIASDNNRSSVWQMLSGIALMAAYKDKTVAFTGATSTATIPALGRDNVAVYKMAMGGKPAFCADCGKHMTSSTVLSYIQEVNTSYVSEIGHEMSADEMSDQLNEILSDTMGMYKEHIEDINKCVEIYVPQDRLREYEQDRQHREDFNKLKNKDIERTPEINKVRDVELDLEV